MAKKNVLVISEQFTHGGLETHILNQVAGIGDKVNFVFAFGKYETNDELKNNTVYDIGSFADNYKVADFHRQVNRLLEIVDKEKIDVIHAHPFLSLLPAMFVSVLSGKPMIYTLHGGPSLSAYSDMFTYNFLQRFFFSYLDPRIVSVRKEFEDVQASYGIKNYNYVPNSLIPNNYKNLDRASNNKWALLTRLDDESRTAITEILNKIDDIGIEHIDIYGSGWAEDEINSLIVDKGLSGRVRLCGWSNGVVGALTSDKYEGVIGHGQVALDGLAAGYPVLLLSYGRVSGLIDKTLYDEIKEYNFINIYHKSIVGDELTVQFNKYHENPSQFILSEDVTKDFNNGDIQKQYLKVIEAATHKYSTQIADMWERISDLISEGSLVASEKLLESWAIEELVGESALRYGFVVQRDLLNEIHRNRRYRKLESIISVLNQKIADQEQEIQSLTTIRNSSKLFVKSIKKKFSK